MGALGLLEVLDRDGQVRQAVAVTHWPLRVGRALDNDVVLSDPHVAAEHLSIAPDERGLVLTVGATRNGVRLGARKLRAGDEATLRAGDEATLRAGDEATLRPGDDATLRAGDATALPAGGEPITLTVGQTRLRLRLPDHTLAPELALAPSASFARRLGPFVGAALLLVAGLLFKVYLDTDPDALARAAGAMLLTTLVGAAVWCGAWALLSKTFTRQARFGWHLRVFVFASLALLANSAVPALLAFALSWPWLSDFAFVGDIAIAAAALYFHLLAVEPAHPRGLRWVAVTCALLGVALTLWFNVQRSGRYGDELYMSHLFPPALRLARPVAVDTFIDGLAPLKATLDRQAREPGHGDDAGAAD
ncbi:MAG: FHA domain-containing protein [Burkholderiales bacterium]|nr:FHA domain-containing protein [Burkholderiales bacterium]